MPSETDISEMVANCHLDISQQMLNRIPAPLRFITDACINVTRRVAFTQRLIKAQLFDL